MSSLESFLKIIETIRQQTGSDYEAEAYLFVRQALDFTVDRMSQSYAFNRPFHITGKELLEGIRDYALDRFGPMSKTVLNSWNIENCEDFGEIVFQMVEFGLLGRSDQDSLADFSDGYDFTEAFEAPFKVSAGKAE